LLDRLPLPSTVRAARRVLRIPTPATAKVVRDGRIGWMRGLTQRQLRRDPFSLGLNWFLINSYEE